MVRNSNPDSSIYQAVDTAAGPLFGVVAASLAKWQDRLVGEVTGWSSLGVTVAATHSEDTERIRMALPYALFLPILFPTTFSDAGAGNWERDVRSALAKTTNELGEAVV